MDIIFDTPRLLLRHFTEQDASLIFKLNSNPEVVKYVHERPFQHEEDATSLIRDIIIPQYTIQLGRWAVVLKENEEFIGWCGLKKLAAENIIDLGYRLRQEAWGRDMPRRRPFLH